MCMLDEILAKRDEIYAVARAHKAEKLLVFGSCARKEYLQTPDSDYSVYGLHLAPGIGFAKNVYGLDIGGVSFKEELRGIQIGGVSGFANSVSGVQVGGVACAEEISGLQVGGLFAYTVFNCRLQGGFL